MDYYGPDTPPAGDSVTPPTTGTGAFVLENGATINNALITTSTCSTPPLGDNSTAIATTAWVKEQGYGPGAGIGGITAGVGLSGGGTSGVVTVSLTTPVAIANGGTGAVTAGGALTALGAAPLNSPTFTGTPNSTTPTAGDNSTLIATTAFVDAAVAAAPHGTITGVAAGAGLTGGGSSGNVSLALSTPVAIAYGGTGATTPAAGLAALGGAPLTGATFTGPVSLPTGSSVAGYNTAAVDAATYLPLAGGTVTGNLLNATALAIPGGSHPVSQISATNLVLPLAGTAGGVATTGDVIWNGYSSDGANWYAIAAGPGGALGVTTGGQLVITVWPSVAAGVEFTTPRPFVFDGTNGHLGLPGGGGITGVTDGSSAPAGCVGEFLTAFNSVTLPAHAQANVVSVTLSPGDWDVEGWVGYAPAGATMIGYSCGLTGATSGGSGYVNYSQSPGTVGGAAQATGRKRYSVTSNTVVWLWANAWPNNGTDTCPANGTIEARRMR